MSTLNIGTNIQISGTSQTITGILYAEGIVPAGSVIFVAKSTVPTGYLVCNGASLSTTTYATLHNAIGYTFGGSGSVFTIPDLRGEFLRCWDNSRGVDSGRSFGTFQDGTWTRQAMDDYSDTDGNVASGYYIGQSYASADATTTSYPSGATTGNGSTFQGVYTDNISLGGQNNSTGINGNWIKYRPRNIALLACIKY